MKQCEQCQETYPSHFTHCPRDGFPLSERGHWTPGSIVRGKYRVLEQCGAGAMAVVYKAEHITFSELRALKVMNADLVQDSELVERFKQEALLPRKLNHPNVVRVDDIEDGDDGRPFIVMEFIQGSDMRQVLRQGRMELHRVIAISRELASALGAAHDLGVIHRDIKPSNIMLVNAAAGETAKLTDFGIAKLLESDSNRPSLTRTGGVIGSPAYMSPEQALGKRGEELDGKSDLYSLGVVMFQALTGQLPLEADSDTAFLLAHVNQRPTQIRDLCPNLPDRIEKLIMSCLEKDPNSRPANAKAFLAALDEPPKTNKSRATVFSKRPEETPPRLGDRTRPNRPREEQRSQSGAVANLLLGSAFCAIFWFAVTNSAAVIWVAASGMLGLSETVYLRAQSRSFTTNGKRLFIAYGCASLLAGSVVFAASVYSPALWAFFEQWIEVAPGAIVSMAAIVSVLLCLSTSIFSLPRHERERGVTAAKLLGGATALLAAMAMHHA